MREDMFKVIVERPRGGRSWARPYKLRHDKDLGRKHAGLKRSVLEQHGNTKHLNENLAPLRRYLHKQKGRKWDDVFSDICARLDTGSTVKMHVREHIEDFVMLRISFDTDGQWLGVNRRWHQPTAVDQWWPDLYVDPHDGILKETAGLRKKLGITRKRHSWPRQDIKRPDLILWQNQRQAFVNFNGCWFAVHVSKRPDLCDKDMHKDITGGLWRTHLNWQVTEQKQLSKKQLVKHGFKNGIKNRLKNGERNG